MTPTITTLLAVDAARAAFIEAYANLNQIREAKTAAWQNMGDEATDADFDRYDELVTAQRQAEAKLIESGDAWKAAYGKHLPAQAAAALATVAANPGTSAYRRLLAIHETAAAKLSA